MPLLRFCESDLQVLTNEVERLRINLLEESNKRRELEELQQDILDGSQDLLQEKKDLEDKLDQLRSELSSERDKREAAENTQEEVELVLSKERAEMQASIEHLQRQFQNEREHLQQQFQNEREHLQNVVREKEDELGQLRSELSSERDRRNAAENTRGEVELLLSRERTEVQASIENLQRQFQNEREHLQEQLQNEREHLQIVEREKQEEVRRLQSELDAAQSRSRGGDERQSWELSRDDINLSDHELGRGGWAVVKKAVFRGCPVAVKQLYGEILSQYNLGLFQREMSIASKCRHPCLLQFIGATTDEKPLIVTELLDTNLRTLLQQRSLQGKEAIVIALDVARALNYLHLHIPPIIHRDVSSTNTLLWLRGSSYKAKVSDYGTANFMMACTTINPGAAVYSASEAESSSSQSTKLDVYSYGVFLCEMYNRQFPSPHERERQVSLVTDDDIASVIKACLREKPAERPDMNGVIEVLRRFASNRGLGET